MNIIRNGDFVVKYEFKAKDSSGKTKSGFLLAESLSDFYAKLHEQKLFCIHVEEASFQGEGSNAIVIGGGRKLKLKDLAIICRQFSTMLNAGLTVIKCLDILYRQAEKKVVKEVLLDLYESIKKGNSLSAAMKEQGKAFPSLLISMVESGESSGTLDEVMLSMSSHYDKERILKGKITTAMIYPSVLIFMTILVVIVLMVKVVPVFTEMFGDVDKLPATTRFLVHTSNAMTNYWYIFLIVIAGIIVGGIFALKNNNLRVSFDKFMINLPLIGKLMIIIATARFSRTVASLYSNGIPIIESIKIASNVIGNRFVKIKLSDVIDDIKKGVTFSMALASAHVFPTMFSSMVYIGEESGALDNILEKTANFYDEDAQSAISKMVALLEPIMIVFMGLIVGFIVISIMSAMFGMYNTIT